MRDEIGLESSQVLVVPGKTSKEAGAKVEEFGERPCKDCTIGDAGVEADGVGPV